MSYTRLSSDTPSNLIRFFINAPILLSGNLDIIPVIEGGDITKEAYTQDGVHVNSGFLDGLDKEEDRKNALVIFTEDVGKDELVQMLKDEKNDNVRMEILHYIPILLSDKEKFFDEVEIGELL